MKPVCGQWLVILGSVFGMGLFMVSCVLLCLFVFCDPCVWFTCVCFSLFFQSSVFFVPSVHFSSVHFLHVSLPALPTFTFYSFAFSRSFSRTSSVQFSLHLQISFTLFIPQFALLFSFSFVCCFSPEYLMGLISVCHKASLMERLYNFKIPIFSIYFYLLLFLH